MYVVCCFFNYTATPVIYTYLHTLSLPDALPISAWNGHFDCTCYHPIFLFNQFGMLERCALRNGNVHSADGWRDVLDPVIARYAGRDLGGRFFRADAAYAIPAIYMRLEEARF